MLTITNNAVIDWEISKSQFISHAYYVTTKEDAEFYINALWQEHPKATHICTAYRLSDGTEKFDDNGEPSYTAGMPILDVLKKQGIENCLIAVVRYYGGKKLGAGGLVRAYSKSASMVLKSIEVVELKKQNVYRFTIDYENHQAVVNGVLLKNAGVKILNTAYVENVMVSFSVVSDDAKKIEDELNLNKFVKNFELINQTYF